MRPAFKNASGTRYLKSLFFELTPPENRDTVVYTLKDYDHAGYPSLYRLYMEMADPLEFRFANEYLDGYEHWSMLCNCTWFKPTVARWRNELELKIRSEALLRLEQDALSGSRSSAQSNRFLLDRGWVLEKNTKGRPSKADIKKEAQRQAQLQKDTEADLLRIKPLNPNQHLTN